MLRRSLRALAALCALSALALPAEASRTLGQVLEHSWAAQEAAHAPEAPASADEAPGIDPRLTLFPQVPPAPSLIALPPPGLPADIAHELPRLELDYDVGTRTGLRLFGASFPQVGLLANPPPEKGFRLFESAARSTAFARYRYYDPEMGRFISTDPLGYVDGPNLYQYALNNPVSFSDPMGLEAGWAIARQHSDLEEQGLDPYSYGKASAEVGDAIIGGSTGILRSPVTAVQAGYQVVRHPVQTAKSLWYTGTHLPTVVAQGYVDFTMASPYEKGQVVGELIGGGFFGGAAAQGTMRGVRAARGILRFGDELADAAMLGFTEGAAEAVTGMAPRAVRTTVEANIARSQAARAASRFGEHVRRVEATFEFERLVTGANARLTRTPALFAEVLSEGELVASASSAGLARMQWGNAVERLIAQEIRSSPSLRGLLRPVGGAGNPDFVGLGRYRGLNFDATTPGQIGAHMARPGYGRGLIVGTYNRPSWFPLR